MDAKGVKDADLQEVVVLGVQGKCDLLGRREDVREILVGELMEFLRMRFVDRSPQGFPPCLNLIDIFTGGPPN